MTTAQYIDHLKTVTTHDEAVTQLTLLSRATLQEIARELQVNPNTKKDTLVLRITANTVDARNRSTIIRNLVF